MAIVIVRTLIIYAALLLTMRLLGKRQLGEMELTEFVLAALIADLASHPLQDVAIPMTNGLVPILTLFCCEVLITGLTMKNIRLRGIFYGKPSVLVERGVIDQREMRRNRFSVDELMQELRNHDCTDISKIEYAVLETDGRLNVILFPAEAPATPAVMGLEAPDAGCPTIVINEGRILDNNLRLLGRDRVWLEKRLRERKLKSAEDVFLMTVNGAEQIYCVKRGEEK